MLKHSRLFLNGSFLLTLFIAFCSIQIIPSFLNANIQQNIILSQQSQILLDDVIEKFFRASFSNEITIDALPGGHSTNGVTSLLITTNFQKYVLRMKAEEPSDQWLKREQYAMEEGARMGISPRVYYTTSNYRAILMEHIAENTLTVAEANQPHNCIAIAKAIRKAHAIQKNPYFGVSDDESVENIFIEIRHNPRISNQLREAIEIMRACNAKLKDFESFPVNNHGDLNSRNMFMTTRGPLLIDWEYTSWADPFDDLSYFSLRHNYDKKTELLFLEAYLGYYPSREELQKFYITKKKIFAMLCIYFHSFSLKFNQSSPNTLSNPPSHEWAYHMIAYSERRDEMSLDQLYFELATCALQLARETSYEKL